MKKVLSIMIVGGVLSVGCAATDQKQSSSEPQEDKDYVTGSAIPKHDRSSKATGVKTGNPEAILDSMNRGTPSSGRGGTTGP